MRKFAIPAVAAAILACAAPAYAVNGNTATGTVNVTGVVTPKCAVTAGGTGNAFSGTIPLGELDGTDGRISSTLTGSTISGASLTFTVVCNTTAPSVSLSATSMGDGVTPPGTQYTSTVDYTAQLDVVTNPGSQTFKYETPSGPQTGGTSLSNPLASTANNVTVSVNSLNTDGGANTSILTAGNYGVALSGGTGGVISITITP